MAKKKAAKKKATTTKAAVKKSGSKDAAGQQYIKPDMAPPKIGVIDKAAGEYGKHLNSQKSAAEKVAIQLDTIERLMVKHKITQYQAGPFKFVLNESRKLSVKKAK